MSEREQMDRELRDLIEIIQFTEGVSVRIHGLLGEAEILRCVKEEFARSKRYKVGILLLADGDSGLRIAETSLTPGELQAAEKASGLRASEYKLDLDKSSILAQVVREGKTIHVNAGDIVNELLPRPLALLISKLMGYERKPVILTPLARYGKVIGVLVMTSTGIAEGIIPSVRNLARHISTALELAAEYTERKQVEVERRELEEKAQLTSRLASIGEMASGIAHEINNPLTGVIGFAQLLMRKDIPEDIRKDVKIINDSAQRVADVVKRLLIFARQHKPEREYVDINEIIETTLALRAYEMETNNIKVTTRLDPDLPRAMADASQLQQVFLNIILNAETEMKIAHGRGNLLLKTETIDGNIRISFEDDGPGIARENLKKIFDPFFTTRKVGEGTGLGLSVCYGIIAEHNGRIYARSRLGKGATVIVELPIIAEAKNPELSEPAAGEAKKVAGARILVVDDEPEILQFINEVLTYEGHRVETVDNADDALDRLRSKRYNLILLDVKLPGMSGIELYKHIQDTAQSLARRVVFITGDVMAADTKAFLSKTKAHYITKPFGVSQLKDGINHILPRGV